MNPKPETEEERRGRMKKYIASLPKTVAGWQQAMQTLERLREKSEKSRQQRLLDEARKPKHQ